jgi:hypothetical protein
MLVTLTPDIGLIIPSKYFFQNCDLGGAVYPTVSLSNHSCVPNTMRHNDGAVVFLRAATTIPKGEEITDNYGHFFQVSFEHFIGWQPKHFFDM